MPESIMHVSRRFSIFMGGVLLITLSSALATTQSAARDHTGKLFSLSFEDRLTGKPVSTEHLRGKVVVVDFWFTACKPCREEIDRLNRLYDFFKPQGVEFIGISLDLEIATLVEYCTEKGVKWPQYCEEGKRWDTSVAREWEVRQTPTIFVLDRDGLIYSSNARPNLEEIILELLSREGRKEGSPE